MIESLRLMPFSTGYSAATVDPLMLSDRVDGDRRLVGVSAMEDSPASNMTAQVALENSAWWRAVNIIGSLVGRTPFHIKSIEASEKGIKKTDAKDHVGYFATTHQANPEQTAMEAKFQLTTNAVMYGAGYAGIWRDAPGGARIYPFETWEIRKERINGKLYYRRDTMPGRDDEDIPEGRFKYFTSREMIEVSGLKKDGLVAYATWWLAKNSLMDGVSSSKMRAARSKNNGRPALALMTDQVLKAETAKRVQEDFMARHAGFDGMGRPAILDNGMKALALPYAADFAAEDALAKIPLREIANWTGVPAVLLGDTAGLSYESLEKLIEMLFRFCIEFYWSSFEDQVNAKLLTEDERRAESHAGEFDRSSMQFMDGQTMAQLIRAWGAGTPIATPNNIRAKLGWEPLDDEEADRLQMPKNIGQDGANNTPADGKANDPGRPAAKTISNNGAVAQSESASKEEVARTELVGSTIQAARAMANAWDDTTRRILKAAERAASNDKAYMHFCDTLDTDQEILNVSYERCRAAGSLFGVLVDEATAAKGLRACKNRLLEVAGVATAGKLHDAFHRESAKLMAILPDLAAKAVLEAA